MASFTYTVWSNASRQELLIQLRGIFDGLGFNLTNHQSGKIHTWNSLGETRIDANKPQLLDEIELPLGVQWWREDDDIYVSIEESNDTSGYLCRITLVGISRDEQAEIAKLLILNVTPEKQEFPDDFYVFRLSAE